MAPHVQGGDGDEKLRGAVSAEEVPLVHKVVVPPRGGVVQEVGHGLWETFLYDAPVGQFKGQSKSTQGWLGLKFVFPILEWITTYTPKKFASDFVAGLTIASLAVPQASSHASIPAMPAMSHSQFFCSQLTKNSGCFRV